MDMIQVFKILNNIDDLKIGGMFEYSEIYYTRGHSKKLVMPRALKILRLNSFCVRTIDR